MIPFTRASWVGREGGQSEECVCHGVLLCNARGVTHSQEEVAIVTDLL